MFIEARNYDPSQKPHDPLSRKAGAEQQGALLPIAPLFHPLNTINTDETTWRVQRQT